MKFMITLPKKPKIIEKDKNKTSFEIEACYPGYGITLGNALRRVLLSSLPGAAITGIKIKGVQHEFSTIPHIMEDVVQIILNLKQIRFKLHTDKKYDNPFKGKIKVKGEKKIKAGDIKTTSELEVINKDAYIATLTDKKADFEMEIDVESGLGYSPVEQRKKGKLEIGKIAIDAIFSPVQKVNYSVENMRVGERTDYDRIRFNIETDGTITPKEAFLKAGQILVDHYKVFISLGDKKSVKTKTKSVSSKKAKTIKKKPVKKEKKDDLTKIKIEDLKIPLRTVTILKKTGLKTLIGLTKKSADELKSMGGLGDKSIVEIKRAIGKLGLTLKS
ncbi:DNA-directed RNA polymerase subunit alpha [Patescibacteria group bacterium]|nr:DNA-directed RNA polymerase subunit alpha [Patescibacteria group bacterium]